MAGGGKGKMTQKIFIGLDAGEISRMVRAILDGDKEEALLFLKEIVKPQVDQATRDQ